MRRYQCLSNSLAFIPLELLEVDVATRLMVQVGDVNAFRNHFMRQSGSVKVAYLQALLGRRGGAADC